MKMKNIDSITGITFKIDRDKIIDEDDEQYMRFLIDTFFKSVFNRVPESYNWAFDSMTTLHVYRIEW